MNCLKCGARLSCTDTRHPTAGETRRRYRCEQCDESFVTIERFRDNDAQARNQERIVASALTTLNCMTATIDEVKRRFDELKKPLP